MNKVVFIGAGPGDPELITLKGRRLLNEADVIVHAGSLVNSELLMGLKAELHDSAGMNLDETTEILAKSAKAGKNTVRLHSGDVSFFSAITEQIERLNLLGMECEVVPGVSSLAAGSAALGQELTIPDVSQSVIVTRMAGRTPVPEKEALSLLASHGTTMVIFLSIGMIDDVVAELKKGGYPDGTPVAVIEKASWPDEKIIKGNIADIALKIKEAGITKTALIYVGPALNKKGAESKLYDPEFKHGRRQ